MKVQTLINKLIEWLSQGGYCKSTLKQYRHCLSKILQYYIATGNDEYNPDITDNFIMKSRNEVERGELSHGVLRSRRKCATWLNECYSQGKFSWSVIPPLEKTVFELNPYYDEVIKEFKNYWSIKGTWCKEHLQTQVTLVRQFLEYLQTAQVASVQDINVTVITDYLDYSKMRHPKSLNEAGAAIRSLGDFLKAAQIEAPDLRLIVPSIPKRITVMPAFSDEEVTQILSSVDRATVMGKRDYAMMLLSAKLGLRAGDVANLKLTDFDWNKPEPELRFVQHKTDHEIILPLETDVGNAIADYILNARPKIKTKELFITTRAPYRGVKASAVTSCTSSYMNKVGIEHGLGSVGFGKGSHSFRRHLATKMLAAEIPYERISEGLGHTNPANLKSYVRSDSKGLAECALNFSEICAVSGVLA